MYLLRHLYTSAEDVKCGKTPVVQQHKQKAIVSWYESYNYTIILVAYILRNSNMFNLVYSSTFS